MDLEKHQEYWTRKEMERQNELEYVQSTNSFRNKNNLLGKRKKYLIHDNGGQPFKVIINSNMIKVYKNEDVYNEIALEITEFMGYWSGFDSSVYKMHGNSILIKVNDNKYIYVGSEIISFETDEIISDYISPVGNSDVPYPIAFGENNVYFMLDSQMIRRNCLCTNISVKNAEMLYAEFYDLVGPGNHKKYDLKNVTVLHERLRLKN